MHTVSGVCDVITDVVSIDVAEFLVDFSTDALVAYCVFELVVGKLSLERNRFFVAKVSPSVTLVAVVTDGLLVAIETDGVIVVMDRGTLLVAIETGELAVVIVTTLVLVVIDTESVVKETGRCSVVLVTAVVGVAVETASPQVVMETEPVLVVIETDVLVAIETCALLDVILNEFLLGVFPVIVLLVTTETDDVPVVMATCLFPVAIETHSLLLEGLPTATETSTLLPVGLFVVFVVGGEFESLCSVYFVFVSFFVKVLTGLGFLPGECGMLDLQEHDDEDMSL